MSFIFFATLLLLLSDVQSENPEESGEYSNPEKLPEDGRPIYGDMVFPPGSDPNNRKLVNDEKCTRWTDGIVPYVNVDLPSNRMDVMRKAMEIWERHSCVKFQDVSATPALQNQPYVKIYSSTSGCSSTVGRDCNGNGRNRINMAPSCTSQYGTPAHELAHTLGLWHEQSRPDRDKFVRILTQNIKFATLSNFLMQVYSTTMDVPYDYCSVMHYYSKAFSSNGQLTIETIDTLYRDVIGQRFGPSFNDIKIVNLAYKCASKCNSTLTCRLKDCFLNKKCNCVCPPVIKSPSLCKQFGPNDAEVEETPIDNGGPPAPPTPPVKTCGTDVTLGLFLPTTTIIPPKIGNNYESNARCIWIITNGNIFPPTRLTLLLYSYDFGEDSLCSDYISINPDGGEDFSKDSKICGKKTASLFFLPVFSVTSNANKISILFVSDATGNHAGFSAIIYGAL